MIVGDCEELMPRLEPGARETVVMLCPPIEGEEINNLEEATFRIKRGFPKVRIGKPNEGERSDSNSL